MATVRRDTKGLRFFTIAVELGIVPLSLSCLTIKAAARQKEPEVKCKI